MTQCLAGRIWGQMSAVNYDFQCICSDVTSLQGRGRGKDRTEGAGTEKVSHIWSSDIYIPDSLRGDILGNTATSILGEASETYLSLNHFGC